MTLMLIRKQDLIDSVGDAVKDIAGPLKAKIAELEKRISIQDGVIEFVYIPVRHMSERADRYEKRCKDLEAELAHKESYYAQFDLVPRDSPSIPKDIDDFPGPEDFGLAPITKGQS